MEHSASFSAQNYRNDGKIHCLVAASGSVASIKLPQIAEALCRHSSISLRIIVTQSAERFLLGQSLEQPALESLQRIEGVDAIYRDEDEWVKPWTRGDNILHIELRKWAHVLLVAPLSANTMAKMTVGIADNLLLSVIRAWDTTGLVDGNFKPQKPRIFVAPAMNSAMWNQPITHQNLGVLQDQWGWSAANPEGWVTVLPPIDKPLACGDVGNGAMMDWRDIVRQMEEHLGLAPAPAPVQS